MLTDAFLFLPVAFKVLFLLLQRVTKRKEISDRYTECLIQNGQTNTLLRVQETIYCALCPRITSCSYAYNLRWDFESKHHDVFILDAYKEIKRTNSSRTPVG